MNEFEENKTSEMLSKLDSDWKMSIKEQIETEINRRVREALDTPPLERMRRRQQEALLKKSEEENLRKNLNNHLIFDGKKRSKFSSKPPTMLSNFVSTSETPTECQVPEFVSDIPILKENNKFEYWLKPHYEPQQPAKVPVKLNEIQNTPNGESKVFKTKFEALENFGSLTLREKEIYFSTFTKAGFLEAMRTGRLPDGSRLEALGNGAYRDKYGIIRDSDGPFWPKDMGPLHPTPQHKRTQSTIEPLSIAMKESDMMKKPIINNLYTAIWRHSQIVYDSEMSARNQKHPQLADNLCPSLIFESRFECGNLRQVRRVGQFEYELILNNDLYTKRHTQWFYFRIQNMEENVSYKFTIVNLLKSTSLYSQGMRMLMYSEKKATKENIGWHRTGSHIRYSRSCTHYHYALLSKENVYFQLEFQLEFPYKDDSCYLSHCYPYTFSDLKLDLSTYHSNHKRSSIIRKEVLCETKLGNSCFLLTITDKNVPDNEKIGAIITARVHPGESNSSWMMKGLIQYLISDCEIANNLRKKILFKIVPMLNPDGVIVGNYRCSTAGRDLNRNYRNPKEESFPTVFHTKKLVENLKSICHDVKLYCDLHGHSRKHNVFMYGCDSQYLHADNVNDVNPVLNMNTLQTFIKDRIFPFLMQKNGPDMFSFTGCHFKIRKCKESTGRVVMWNQFNITDSYTLESTFSGTDLNSTRHFNVDDLENIGKVFSESLSSYVVIMGNENMEKEVGLELLKTILKELVTKNKQVSNIFRQLAIQKNHKHGDQDVAVNLIPDHSTQIIPHGKSDETDIDLESFINSLQMNDINHLKNMNFEVSDIEENSSSSDSDSESQPEEILDVPGKPKMKIKKNKKTKIKSYSKELKDISNMRTTSKKVGAKTLPVISKKENSIEKLTKNISIARKSLEKSIHSSLRNDGQYKKGKNKPIPSNCENISVRNQCNEQSIISNLRSKANYGNEKIFDENINGKIIPKRQSVGHLPLFTSKYEGRSNGGIPCFSEERILARAKRKSVALLKKDLEDSFLKFPFDFFNQNSQSALNRDSRLICFLNAEENMSEQYQDLQETSNDILKYRTNDELTVDDTSDIKKERILEKPEHFRPTVKQISIPHVKEHENGHALKSAGPLIIMKEAIVTKYV